MAAAASPSSSSPSLALHLQCEFSSSGDQEAAALPIILEPDDESNSQLPTTIYDSCTTMGVPRDDTMEIHVPTHPIPSMQEAFSESMLEAPSPQPRIYQTPSSAHLNCERQRLIDQPVSEETHAARWRQKPGQQYHQLWKLMAQISFGIYLLLNGIAKDDEQVMTILQGHVDEVDEFLETTLEDFDLAPRGYR